MPTSIRSRGAEKRIRSAVAVTVTTTAATNRRLSAVSTPQCFHGPPRSSRSPWPVDMPGGTINGTVRAGTAPQGAVTACHTEAKQATVPAASRRSAIARETDAVVAELISIRRDIHAHPEIGHEEHRTTGLIVDLLERCGLVAKVLPVGTGAYCDVLPPE